MDRNMDDQHKNWISDIKNKIERSQDFNAENYRKRQKAVLVFLVIGVLVAVATFLVKGMVTQTESLQTFWAIIFFCALVVMATAILSLVTNRLGYSVAKEIEIEALKIEKDELTGDLVTLCDAVAEWCPTTAKEGIRDTCKKRGASQGLVENLVRA